MTKVKFDVRNVDDTTFEQPKPGIYPAKIDTATAGESKAGNPQLTITFKISSGDFKGALMWHYVPTDPDAPGAFRMRELLKAIGIKAERGEFDTDKITGKPVQIRVKEDTYNGEYKPKVSAVIPAGDADDEEPEDLTEPEDAPAAANGADPEAAAEPDAGDEDADDYDEWELEELKTELKERGLRTAGGKAALIKRLRKDDEEDEEDDPFS